MLTHIGTQTIETERLILRRFTPEDAGEAFRHWAGDESVQNDYGEPVYGTVEETAGLLARYIAAYERPETYRWAIDLKTGERCVGQAAYFLVDTHNRFGEVEYCIGRAYQNRGYVTEAVGTLVEYGFQRVLFNRIQVSHRHVNISSRRVIEKCGFTYEGTLRQFFNHLGEFHDRLYYAILREEWLAANRAVLWLVLPSPALKQAALAYRQEHFDNGEREIHGDGGLDHAQSYEDWLALQERVRGLVPREGWVPATTYFAVVSENVVGTIQIRHSLNDFLLGYGGHIGYGVRPFQRRKGYATRMLALALEECRRLGIDRALVTCDKDNTGSVKTILNNGGVLENEVERDGTITQRYWIML